MLGVGYFKFSDKYDHWYDTFNYSTMAYTALTNYTTSTLPSTNDGVAWTATTARSFALPSVATVDFDSSAAYMIGITIAPYAGSHGAVYRRPADAVPDEGSRPDRWTGSLRTWSRPASIR